MRLLKKMQDDEIIRLAYTMSGLCDPAIEPNRHDMEIGRALLKQMRARGESDRLAVVLRRHHMKQWSEDERQQKDTAAR